jgi:antitoxin component of MazEF toxin-antitoxin module
MEALKLEPGDEVEFHVKGEAAVLVPIKTIKVPRDQA